MQHLKIKTPITVSSHISMDHSLRSQNRVLEICEKREANCYVNPIGGIELYRKVEFYEHNIELQFLRTEIVPYKQAYEVFIPSLSILDVLMFNGVEKTKSFLDNYKLE